MEFISALWLPILLSAVFVFVVSSVIHMFLGYHASDFKQIPNEEKALDALRQLNIPPGDYIAPRATSMKEMGTEEYKARVKRGPVVILTVRDGDTGMGKSLLLWFLYILVVSFFSAYIGVNALDPDAHYLAVFRIVGCAAFMGYALALFQNTIWMAKDWGATLKSAFDGLIYALITAGTFGWMW